MTTMPTIAMMIQFTSSPRGRKTYCEAKYEKPPMRDASKTMYATAASRPEAMPQIWPRPWEMKP